MRRHLPLLAVAAVQQIAFWAVVLSNNPQATVTFDCVSGAMAQDILRGFAYSPLDTYDGILGGMALGATAGLPIFAAFGITGLSVKAAASVWALATVGVGYTFLDRAIGRRAAVLGGLVLALPMPTTFLASTILGNWHFTELLFELALAGGLSWLVWGGGVRRRGALFAFGLLSGLALFNCFGTLVFFGAFWLLMWALLRQPAGLRGIASYALGTALGASPLWVKLLLHTPYGAPTLRGGAGVPKELLALSFDPGKLRDLLVDNGFSWGLHFQDALDVPQGSVLSMTLATAVTIALFLGWIGLVIVTWPSIRAVLRGLLPGRAVAPRDVSPAVILTGMGAFYLLAWLLSDMSVAVRPWYLANVRDLGHATLIPWATVMALCGSALADGGSRPGERALGPPGRRVALVGVVLMIGVDGFGIGHLAAHEGPHPATSIYRGLCHDVHGFYMGPHVVGPEAATSDGAPLPASRSLARAEESCRPYGPDARLECLRGVFWSLGFGEVDFGDPGRAPQGENRCLALPQPWRGECLRGMGWALQSLGEGGIVAASPDVGRCAELPRSEDVDACWWGVGFPLGDHLSNRPRRLMRALQDFPPRRREAIARGAATHLGRTYSSWSFMAAMCRRWDPPYRRACVEGVEDSMAFRPDAAAVRAR